MSREEALEFIESLPTSRAGRRKQYRELGMNKAQQVMAEDHVRQLRLIREAQQAVDRLEAAKKLREQAKDVFG